MSVCANCGKGEEDGSDLKTCTACMLVKYCSRDCQAAHRPQHKRECKKRAKELHDEKLFEQPQPLEDCPICMIRLPTLSGGRTYMHCCGKTICTGCIITVQSRAYQAGRQEEDDVCPFCRSPPPKSDEEKIKRYEKRIELNDADAFHCLGCSYFIGSHGLPQNYAKALELWHRAGELGSASAYHGVGVAYRNGHGVEKDEKKAVYYWELAAMGGGVEARGLLGVRDLEAGNWNRALRHFKVAVKDGSSMSLTGIRAMYEDGHATKDDYAIALRSYQVYLDEIKSDQRDKAAACNDEYKYYGSSIF